MSTAEVEAIYIHKSLTDAGYLLKYENDRWRITEPQRVFMPQGRVGLRNLSECAAWADGGERARNVLMLNLNEAKRHAKAMMQEPTR